jgi:hypothetical protein
MPASKKCPRLAYHKYSNGCDQCVDGVVQPKRYDYVGELAMRGVRSTVSRRILRKLVREAVQTARRDWFHQGSPLDTMAGDADRIAKELIR